MPKSARTGLISASIASAMVSPSDRVMAMYSPSRWLVNSHRPGIVDHSMRTGAGPGNPAPVDSVEQGGDRARADGAAALADGEGLAGVERDRLTERDGDLHRLSRHGRGHGGAAATRAAE